VNTQIYRSRPRSRSALPVDLDKRAADAPASHRPAAAQRGALGVAVAIGCSLAGCVMGPRYAVPPSANPVAFKEGVAATAVAAAPGVWRPALPEDAALKGKWWEVFGEPELNALEEELNIDNRNIAQYLQNFMASRALVREARAGLFPTLSVSPSYARSTTGSVARGLNAGNSATTPAASSRATLTTTFASLPADVAWAPDVWGRVQGALRAARAAAEVSAADLENERLSEQAALAVYYFELRGQDSLQDLYDRTIAADRQSLDLTRALFETGIDGAEAVAEAELTLRSAEATGIGIATNRALYEHAIATLVGRAASGFSMPVQPLATAAPAIPVGVPSQLLERRPDVAAAERTVAQANALIGVQMTAYFPTLNLTGSGGFDSPAVATLLSAPAFFWSLGAAATETIFDGGLRRATVAQYEATYKADVAAYQQTVLAAVEQVEDDIATLRVTSEQIMRQAAAVDAARRYVDIATARYETGLGPYLAVMAAQTALLGGQQALVVLRVSEMTAAVQLIEALGGGWNKSQLPAVD
jgi:NodT family efflux transporter outer membrane factor (OMF) lipoprotein